MAKILTKSNVLKIIAEQQLGFSFGNPERLSEEALCAVLPILRKTTTKRQYITYPETDEVIVTDSGSINRMNVKNTSKENIFLRSGTIFRGKTQERALTRSTVVFPGQEVGLDVRCIHASKGIKPGAKTTYGGITPLSMDMKTYDDGYRPQDQSSYWNTVHAFTSSITPRHSGDQGLRGEARTIRAMNMIGNSCSSEVVCDVSLQDMVDGGDPPRVNFAGSALHVENDAPSGADDLAANMDGFAKSFDDILSKIKLHNNQVGFGLINTDGCQTVELFDVGDSWAALHKDAIRRVGDKLGDKEPQPFEFKEKTAIENVQWVLSREFKMNTIYEHKPANGEPNLEISGMTHEKFVGEIVELDGKVIHLVIIRKSNK